ncbi:hypothetical protein Tco_0065144 [Tanacetum coccineum]
MPSSKNNQLTPNFLKYINEQLLQFKTMELVLGGQTSWKQNPGQENPLLMDEESVVVFFYARRKVTNFDDDVDDLALNVDHVFEADQCDAFDSDVDELPPTSYHVYGKSSSEDHLLRSRTSI